MTLPPHLQETLNILSQSGGNISQTARVLGLHRKTVTERLKRAEKLENLKPNVSRNFDVAEIPLSEAPIEEIIERASRDFERRHAAKTAKEWRNIKINIDGPYGLAWVGDPHLDDNGCNWPLLRNHIAIINQTEGMYAVGMGDYLNNWTGRLARLYGSQDASQHTGWRMLDWFLHSVDWVALIKGNHDMWSGANDPLDWMFRGKGVMEEWQAKIAFVAPNGHETKVHMAHSFKGHSMYNPVHGPMRAQKFSGLAHIYVQGHHHEWAAYHSEDAERKIPFWAVKARGYKYIDSYADLHGFGSQKDGATVLSIIDPSREGAAAIQCYPDLEHGAHVLTLMREEWKRKNGGNNGKKVEKTKSQKT